MYEPPSTGAAGRLSAADQSGLQRRLTSILRASPGPTVCVSRHRDDGGDLLVAGATLYDLARRRTAALTAAGMRAGDVLASAENGLNRATDALAAVFGSFVYWPCVGSRDALTGSTVADSGAPLVWRANPLTPESIATPSATHPPAVLPARLSRTLHDVLNAGGAQTRVLVYGSQAAPPFAVQAQTVGRLGSTLRRKLGGQRHSVRYCAAPAHSAAGVLLDLLPAIAGRQVIVLPSDAVPSAFDIACAISRYKPDTVTLTLAQATALLETEMDDQLRTALQNVRLLVADTLPIPLSLRAALAGCVARLDLAYILPEAGGVYVL
jgi:hypothetical protein